MLRLVYSISPHLQAYSIHKQKVPIFSNGFVNDANPWVLMKRSRRNGAAEKDSDFEVDPDKAREALRKLDQQMKSLSEKKINPPKIRDADLSQESPPMTQGTSMLSGPFLSYLASALLIFTIVYNVIFITVIKPSIDGDDRQEPISATEVTAKDTQDRAAAQQL